MLKIITTRCAQFGKTLQKHAIMKKSLLLPLVAALWSLQCQKDEPVITLQGRITEYGTGKPLEGARVYLMCYGGGFWGSSESEQTDSIITDADGRFFQQFPADEVCGGAYLIVWKEGYFKRDGLGVTTGDNQLDIVLDPEAWLELVTVPGQGVEHLIIGGDFWGGAGWNVYSSQGLTMDYFLVRGNKPCYISWRPYGFLDLTQFDSVYLPAHDTTTYTIHY